MFSLYITFSIEKLFLTNMIIIVAESVKIDKIIVPDVVQSGNSSAALLDCIYTGVRDKFTVQWLFGDREPPVYEWTPHSEPLVRGILSGKLDLTYKASASLTEERRALRIVTLYPELSGDYTCRILDGATEARQTKSMLVFSPEKEFAVEFYRKGQEIDIKCIARGLYPQPEIILICNGFIFPRQQVRVWRSEGVLYDTEDTAVLSVTSADCADGGMPKPKQITCRLQIPQAGYTAIKNKLLCIGQECGNRSSKAQSMVTLYLLLIMSLAMQTAMLGTAVHCV